MTIMHACSISDELVAKCTVRKVENCEEKQQQPDFYKCAPNDKWDHFNTRDGKSEFLMIAAILRIAQLIAVINRIANI